MKTAEQLAEEIRGYGWWQGPEEPLEELQRRAGHEELLREALAAYDRRMATRRGRFLLWLLRKTT